MSRSPHSALYPLLRSQLNRTRRRTPHLIDPRLHLTFMTRRILTGLGTVNRQSSLNTVCKRGTSPAIDAVLKLYFDLPRTPQTAGPPICVTASNLFCCKSPKALEYQIIGIDRQIIEGGHVALDCAILVYDRGVDPGDEGARGCLGLRKLSLLTLGHSLTDHCYSTST